MSESMKVEWSDALQTGNRAIDNQHKYLIDIINDLADVIEAGGSTQAVKKIVNLLQYYTEWHFCNEEACMEERRCPVAAKNKNAHKQFIETFLGFRAELDAGGDSLAIGTRMYKTLTSWLIQHIQGVDAVAFGAAETQAAVAAATPDPEKEGLCVKKTDAVAEASAAAAELAAAIKATEVVTETVAEPETIVTEPAPVVTEPDPVVAPPASEPAQPTPDPAEPGQAPAPAPAPEGDKKWWRFGK